MFSSKSHVNISMLMRVVGWLLIIEAAFMAIPLATCLVYGESDYRCFAAAIAVTAFAGFLMTMGIRPKRTDMGKREGFLLTALVWVVFSLFGMIPFLYCSTPMSLSDAYFEAMSGFTTTGASIIEFDINVSHGILMWRSLMQWIGGMGIILFTLAVVPMLNSSGGMAMFNAEVTGITHDKLRPRISQTAKSLWNLYFAYTIVLIGLLWIGPMDLYESLNHAFSTISTGGFSTRVESIAAFHSHYVEIVLTIFMFLGGANFALMIKGLTGSPRTLWSNETFRLYVGIIAAMSLIFAVAIVANGQFTDWSSVTIDPIFQVVSTITSTGYTALNFENWGTFVLSLVFLMMFFGACAGSTSGGAKLDRMAFAWKYVRNEIYRCLHPNSILPVRINSRVMNPELVNKVIAFLCIYVTLIMVGGMVLTAFGIPLVDAFFSSFSAISNTGLGAGVTGYGGSYEIIPDAGKWVLAFLMLVGRLEIYTVLILFTAGFWKK